MKDFNEIQSIRKTFGDTVIGCAVKYIVNITYNDTNTSERIYILRNGTLSQWISNSNSNSNISIGCIAVSYTHLDVYKRQVRCNCIV